METPSQKTQKTRNDIWYAYARGYSPSAISSSLGYSLTWVKEELRRMMEAGPYLEGAHLRARRSPYRRARFVISPEERWAE